MHEVVIYPSRYFIWLTVVSYSSAVLALWLSGINVLLKDFFSVVLVLHFIYFVYRFVFLKHSLSILAVRLYQEYWRIRLADGWHRVWPIGEVVVTSFLICLKLKCEGSNRSVRLILFPDSGATEELHGLRLRLMLDRSRLFQKEE